jgi:hypothetical protein
MKLQIEIRGRLIDFEDTKAFGIDLLKKYGPDEPVKIYRKSTAKKAEVLIYECTLDVIF